MADRYGEDQCSFRVVLIHVFDRQGTFWPLVTASSPHASLTAKVSQPVTIEAPLAGLTIRCPSIVAIHQLVNFTAHFESEVSSQVSYEWDVEALFNGPAPSSAIHWQNKEDELLTVNFTHLGQYNVSVTARNNINSITAEVTIRVLVAISGLNLTWKDHTDQYVALGETVTLVATISNGSNPLFEWEIVPAEDDNLTQIVDTQLSSTLTHTFKAIQEYRVSVFAFNDYNSQSQTLPFNIVVQEPVENLIVKVHGTTRLNEAARIDAMVTGGSHVNFDFDFGMGRQLVPFEGAEKFFVTQEHVFETSGPHTIMVYAYNKVSSKSQSVTVEVQDKIGEASISTYPKTPVKGVVTVFVVKLNGQYILSSV